MQVSIETNSPEGVAYLKEALKNPMNAIDVVQATGNTVDLVIHNDYEAALELLSLLVTAQPQYFGMGLNTPLSDALKQTASILRNRQNQIDAEVDKALGNINDSGSSAKSVGERRFW